jgi:hypothetical protein
VFFQSRQEGAVQAEAQNNSSKHLRKDFVSLRWSSYTLLTQGSITPLRFWEEVPWSGLCSHFALIEINFASLKDSLPNLDEIRLARVERQKLDLISRKERSRTDKEFREKKDKYDKQYNRDCKNKISRTKYKGSRRYKSTEAAYKASEALAKTKSKYATSDKNKAAQAEYAVIMLCNSMWSTMIFEDRPFHYFQIGL